jgi:hypothetical protein
MNEQVRHKRVAIEEEAAAKVKYRSRPLQDFIRSAIRTQLESLGLKVKPIIRRYYK